MEKYLYKITTAKASPWGSIKPKPVYLVASSKEEAHKIAATKLKENLAVAKVTLLGRQLNVNIFVGER